MNLQEADNFLCKIVGRNIRCEDFNPKILSHRKFDLIYKTFIKYLKANFPPGPSYKKFTCIRSPYVKNIIVASRSQDNILGTQAARDLNIDWCNKKREILPSSKKDLTNKYDLILGHIQHDDDAVALIEGLDFSILEEEIRISRQKELFTFNIHAHYTIITRCFEFQFKPSKFIKGVHFYNIDNIFRCLDLSPEFKSSFPYMESLMSADAEDEEKILETDGRRLMQEIRAFVGEEDWKSLLTHEELSLRRLYVAHTEDTSDLVAASTDKDSRIRDMAILRLKTKQLT